MEKSNTESQVEEREQAAPTRKMKWYYFIIYFWLFYLALSTLVSGISYLSGSAYSNAERIYSEFSELKSVDMFFGALWLAFTVYAIVVRQLLAGFKRCAAVCLHVLLIIFLCSNFVYWITVLGIVGGGPSGMRIYSIVVQVVAFAVCAAIIPCNFAYFKKRRYWFNGSPTRFDLYDDGRRFLPDDHDGDDWWFAFLIYIALFASAAVGLISGLYSIILLALENVFSVFEIILFVFAVFCVIIAVMEIAARFLLARFKRGGVICLHIDFCLSVAIHTFLVVTEIVASCVADENMVDFWDVLRWLYVIAVTIANFVYFKRRKHIFT